LVPPNWFIALPIDARELPASELDALPPGTRRFHPADLHVTVAFLGAVGRDVALRAWETTEWSRQPAMQAHVGARAALGPRRRPSAYGLELDDAEGHLRAFVEHWRDRLLAVAGRPGEQRPVRPHVTLGRPRRGRGDTIRVRAWLAASPPPTAVTLDRVALYTRADPPAEHRFAVHRESRLAPGPMTTGDASVPRQRY